MMRGGRRYRRSCRGCRCIGQVQFRSVCRPFRKDRRRRSRPAGWCSWRCSGRAGRRRSSCPSRNAVQSNPPDTYTELKFNSIQLTHINIIKMMNFIRYQFIWFNWGSMNYTYLLEFNINSFDWITINSNYIGSNQWTNQ